MLICVFYFAQKHTEAIYNLGLMYAYDRGVGKDYLHAAMLFNEVTQPASVRDSWDAHMIFGFSTHGRIVSTALLGPAL